MNNVINNRNTSYNNYIYFLIVALFVWIKLPDSISAQVVKLEIEICPPIDTTFFSIQSDELNLDSIPICVEVFYRHMDVSEQQFYITNKNGKANIKISFEYGQFIRIEANPNPSRKKNIKFPLSNYYKPDYDFYKYIYEESSEIYELDGAFILNNRSDGIVNIKIPISLGGEIGKVLNKLKNFTDPINDSDCSRQLSLLEYYTGSKSEIRKNYPSSSKKFYSALWQWIYDSKKGEADQYYSRGDLKNALEKYNQIKSCFNDITENEELKNKINECLVYIQESTNKQNYRDSILVNALSIKEYSKRISYLQKHKKKMVNDSEGIKLINKSILELEDSLRIKEENEKVQRMVESDRKALSKYKVDLDITLADLYMNPFVHVGKYFAFTCVVIKFESPTHALLSGAKYIYADFKVPTPKKLQSLYVIAKMKGTKNINTQFNGISKIPLMEIVQYLNFNPTN